MTPKEQMEQARTLIQQKRYTEARTLLKQVNHPTAAQWLAKLDEIDPPKRSSQPLAPLDPAAAALDKARILIQQKRYTEARAILKPLNHPTATQWLFKLDELDPPLKPAHDWLSSSHQTYSIDDDFSSSSGSTPFPKRATGTFDPMPATPAKQNNSGLMYFSLGIIGITFACCLAIVAGLYVLKQKAEEVVADFADELEEASYQAVYNQSTPRGNIKLNSNATGTISPTNKADRWTFTITDTKPVTIMMTSDTFDEEIYVYDPQLNGILIEDGTSEQVVITFTPSQPGTYTVIAHEWGDYVVKGGKYILSVLQ